MKKLIHLAPVLGLILLIVFCTVLYAMSRLDYTRGKFGDKCYPKGEEHGNIKYRLYYTSLEDCESSLNK